MEKTLSNDLQSSIMEILKRETKAQHTQIEQIPQMKRLFSNDYSLAEYRTHLEKMYGYLSAIEKLILQNLTEKELQTFFLNRSKQGRLMQDLLSFGLTGEQILALPKCESIDFINSPISSLGACYVIEGSSLGGQVILKQLNKQFADNASDKLRFYQGYGSETMPKWQEFCQLMDNQFFIPNPKEVEEIILAAKLTFTSLSDWLTSC